MIAPTAEEVRDRSDFLLALYPREEPERLDVLIAEATALVSEMTCRDIGHGSGAEVPTGLVPLAHRAVVLKTEQIANARTSKATKRRVGASLRSFSAGSYAESYFDPGTAQKARQLDADQGVHETLWTLATEECRERWLATWSGEEVPASLVVSPNWSPPSY